MKLKTVTVTYQYVIGVDSDHKDEYSTARMLSEQAFRDMCFAEMDVDIEDYKEGDAGYDDKSYIYSLRHDITIAEAKEMK